MDATQFAYWLNGFAELSDNPPTPAQWKSICEHLAAVFNKVTPPVEKNADASAGLKKLLQEADRAKNQKEAVTPFWPVGPGYQPLPVPTDFTRPQEYPGMPGLPSGPHILTC